MKEALAVFMVRALLSLSIGFAVATLLEVAIWASQGTSVALVDRLDITLEVALLVVLKPGPFRALLGCLKRSRP